MIKNLKCQEHNLFGNFSLFLEAVNCEVAYYIKHLLNSLKSTLQCAETCSGKLIHHCEQFGACESFIINAVVSKEHFEKSHCWSLVCNI